MRMPLLIDVLTELFNWTLNYEKNLILIWKATVFLLYKSNFIFIFISFFFVFFLIIESYAELQRSIMKTVFKERNYYSK